ncbi:KapH [Arthroderma uncinatum]|uniref:KapH n=1 Tax=Arthroderma uncinatum TaxID=74035 RepID=UPI00144AE51E|nr:KapH [Arthroderma uncinatum]KAF3484083.1 KapH [Arthroderma uncinatum]
MPWPEAITEILAILRASTQPGSYPIQLPRTLLILLQVIKALSTGRLEKTRRGLQSVAPELFHVVANIYVEKVQKWGTFLESGGDDEGGALEAVEQSLMALKVIRRLIVSGFEYPNRESDVQGFWALSLTHLSNFYSLLQRQPSTLPPAVEKLISKHVLQLSKLHLEMARSHPAAFGLFPQSVDMVKSYWGLVVELGKTYGSTDLSKMKAGTDGDADEDEQPFLEKLCLKALLLLRACAKLAFYPTNTFKYQKQQFKEEKSQCVSIIKSEIFNEEFVVQVMELLVTRFFVFRASDLREWEEEPEEWEKREEEEIEAWEFSIRSCAEKLFLDLVINFKELLIPKLLNVFYSYANPENKDILLKDSLYSAVGLAAACLEKRLDFNSFLTSTLVPEIQIQGPGYNILRRRISVILGQWVPVKPSEVDKTSVYGIFQHLLNKDDPINDQVVRVTAGRRLRQVLDPFEFSAEQFQPFSTPILQSLLELIQEVTLVETKMALLETVRVAVVKMEHHISPFADQIVSLLPGLWEQSGEEHLMKQAILTLLSSLIHSMREDSTRYHSMILPLIQKSIEPGSETLIYLLEESLDLWSAVLSETPSPASPEVLALFPSVFPIFAIGSDVVRQALEVTESYILLAPREFLDENIRFRLLDIFSNLLNPDVKPRIGLVPHLAELLVRTGESATEENSDHIYGAIAKSLLGSGFMETLLSALYGAYESRGSTGPNRKQATIYGVAETDHFSVLARLALASPRNCISAVTSAVKTSSEEQTFTWILNEWFAHFDSIGDINKKKLHTMALTHLLTVNGPSSPAPTYLLNNLQSYLTVWTDVITELSDGPEVSPGDARHGDYLIFGPNEGEGEKYQDTETPETTRRRAWSTSDVIHKINIREFVGQHLHALVQVCGGTDRFRDEWLVNVDREVVNGFGQLGIM